MAETEDLPEEIIVNILTWLPLKSLIRFTSVSKRLRSIILSDPKFAQSQLNAARQQKTLSRRLLVSSDAPRLELDSLDLDTPSFGEPSSVRKLSFPVPPRPGASVKLLGSCNGLVFVAFDENLFYIWNPSIGFFKQLPDPGFPLDENALAYYGVGYLSATDDYKVLVASYRIRELEIEVEMFSSTTHIWQRIESPRLRITLELDLLGTLSNDALHWLKYDEEEEEEHEIVSFDLEDEVFRRMPLPNFDHDGKNFSKLGVCGGCLCVSRYPDGVWDSIDFWVMREYAVSGSWIMIFSLQLSHPPELHSYSREFLVVESCTVAANWTAEGFELIRIDHKEDEKLGRYMVKGVCICMVEYEESLLWISGYHSGKRDRAGQDTRNPSKGLRKLKWK